jgi:Tfp pilus assembly protein PilF
MSDSRRRRIEILKGYLEEDSSDVFSRYALALEWLAEGNTQAAADELAAVLQADASYLAAYYQLGRALEMLQRRDDAAHIYRKGLDIARMQRQGRTEAELAMALEGLQDDE